MTIGIQGDWGVGKTSLLNMIAENLRARRGRPAKFCRIETWQYAQISSEAELTSAVIAAINQAIISYIKDENKRKEFVDKYTKLASKIGRAAAVAAGNLLKEKIGIDVSEIAETFSEQPNSINDATLVEKYKEEFRRLVSTVAPGENDRVVIALDDLDRLKPVRALELLEAIKNFMDVEKAVFILAIDYSVVRQGVKAKLGKDAKEFYGKSFFDKIIQVPYNMPISAYDVEAYVMALMGWERAENGEVYVKSPHYSQNAFLGGTNRQYIPQEDAELFTHILSLTTNNNPRSIKRILNYANLLRMIFKENKLDASERNRKQSTWGLFEAKLLLTLAAMHLSWPEVFHFFAQNPSPSLLEALKQPNFLESLNELRPLYERVPDPARTRAQISGLFNSLIGILDQDSSGDISAKEFEPLWDALVYANLANIKLEDTNQALRQFAALAIDRASYNPSWNKEMIDKIVQGFLSSEWNNPLFFRILESSKYVRILEWKGKAIGSFTSKKSAPIDFYISSDIFSKDPEATVQEAPESIREFLLPYSAPHYGYGNIRILSEKLAGLDTPEITARLNDLLKFIDAYIG